MIRITELIEYFNIKIFKFFNHNFGQPFFNEVTLLLDHMFHSYSFIYFFIFYSVVVAFILYSKRLEYLEFEKFFLVSLSTFIIFVLANIFCLPTVLLFKHYTQLARPFCNNHHHFAIEQIISKLSCNESFPSGHMSMATIFITSFWPLFNHPVKILAIAMIFLVAVSRMATAAHYPIDVIGAVILVLPLTLCIQHKIVNLFAQNAKAKKLAAKIRQNLCL